MSNTYWRFFYVLISGKMKYPMNLMTLFMDMETMLSSDLDEGLKNLKEILEYE